MKPTVNVFSVTLYYHITHRSIASDATAFFTFLFKSHLYVISDNVIGIFDQLVILK